LRRADVFYKKEEKGNPRKRGKRGHKKENPRHSDAIQQSGVMGGVPREGLKEKRLPKLKIAGKRRATTQHAERRGDGD